MTGVGLLIGSFLALPLSKMQIHKLRLNLKQLALGIYGLLGYHLALFIALKSAPAVEANLINYLWPLLIVLLTPFYIKGERVSLRLAMAALMGFAGATIAIASSGLSSGSFALGYLFAFVAALVWATYSLGIKRVGEFPTAAVGVFAFVAGLSSLIIHLLFETPKLPTVEEWNLLFFLGIGPLGAAFYFWDYAMKKGNPQQIGLLAFLTPLLSTILLVSVTGRELSVALVFAGVLIISAALLGNTQATKRQLKK